MLKILIVDDELPARDELTYLVSKDKDIVIIGEADSAAAAIQMAVAKQPDVIFLDIDMRDVTGLEAGLILRRVVPQALLVFATAYDQYALKAFEIGAVDYVLKPFEESRIAKAIARIKNYRREDWLAAEKRLDEMLTSKRIRVNKLAIERNGKIEMVPYQEVLYAYTHLGTVVVVLTQGEGTYPGTLSELEERVRGTSMMRVHKSYLVNMDKVKEVVPWFKGTYWLKVENREKEEIPVSKTQIKEIKGILGLK